MSKRNVPDNLPADLYDGLSDTSTEESFVLYQNMQRIPNVPLPNFKEPSRKLFRRASPSVPRVRKSTLFKLFNKEENMLACSTPASRSLANNQMNQSSLLELSPITAIANKSVEAAELGNDLIKGLRKSKSEESLPRAKKVKSINSSIRAVVEHLSSLRNNSLKENVKKKRKKSRKDNSITKLVKTKADCNFVGKTIHIERETQTTDSLTKELPRVSVVLTPIQFDRVRRKCDDGNTTDVKKLKRSSENTRYNPMLNEFLNMFDASVSSSVPSIITISSTSVETSTGAVRQKTKNPERAIKEKAVTDEACKQNTSLLPRSEFKTSYVSEVNENIARNNDSISKHQENSSLKEDYIIRTNNISKQMATDHLSINTTNKDNTNDEQNVSQEPMEIVEAADSATVNVRKQPEEKRSSARIRERSKNLSDHLSIDIINNEETPNHINKEGITVRNHGQNASQRPIEIVEAADNTSVNVRKQPEKKPNSTRLRDRSKNLRGHLSTSIINKEETPKHINKEGISFTNDEPFEIVEAADSTSVNVRKQPEENPNSTRLRDRSKTLRGHLSTSIINKEETAKRINNEGMSVTSDVSQKPIEIVEPAVSATVNIRKQPGKERSTAKKNDRPKNSPSKSQFSSINSEIVMGFDSISSVLTNTTGSVKKKGRPKGSRDKVKRFRRTSSEISCNSKSRFVSRLSGFIQVTNISNDEKGVDNEKSGGRVLRQRRPPPVYVQSTLLVTSTKIKKTSELHLTRPGSVLTRNINKLTLSPTLEDDEVENQSVFKKPLPKQNKGIPKKRNLSCNSKSVDILKTVDDCTTSENSQKQTDNEDVLHGIENLNAFDTDSGTSTMSKDMEANTETYSPVASCSHRNDQLSVKEAIHEPTPIKDSRSSNVVIHQNIVIPPLSVESNLSEKSKDHHKENVTSCSNYNPSPAEISFQQEENGNMLYTLIDNKVVGLEWMSKMDTVNTDDSQDLTVSYAFKNLKTPWCTFSSGLVKFRPGKQMNQVTKTQSIVYKVEQGQALVCIQLQRKCVEVGCFIHIPLGSHYTIQNSSQAEPLILSFNEMCAG